jgi:hypothetical protein
MKIVDEFIETIYRNNLVIQLLKKIIEKIAPIALKEVESFLSNRLFHN